MAGVSTNGAVILIPGFMGSELSYTDGRDAGTVLWSARVGNPVRDPALMLAADGRSPFSLIGRSLIPTGPVGPYYTEWVKILTDQQQRYHFGPVTQYPWDWRRSLLDSVPGLVGTIQAFGQQGPVNLVGHSMGGLLARLAWAALVDTGQTALVRRVVTVGTPHQGSYEAARALAGFESFYDGWLWSAVYGWHQPWPLTGRGVVTSKSEFWASIGGTWPGLYQLLPAPDTSALANTLRTDVLYTRSSYPVGKFLIQGWLDEAKNVVWPRLTDPKYAIPANQLWTLAGSGTAVVSSLGNLIVPFTQGVFDGAPTTDGDGVVTLTSQLVEASQQRTAPANHRDEPSGFVRNGMIGKALSEALETSISKGEVSGSAVYASTPQTPYPAKSGSVPQSTVEFGSYPPSRANVGDP